MCKAVLLCLVPAKKRSFRASLIRHCHPEHTIRTVTLNLFQSLFFISYYRLSIVDNISNINILHMRFRNKFGMTSMRSFFLAAAGRTQRVRSHRFDCRADSALWTAMRSLFWAERMCLALKKYLLFCFYLITILLAG